MIDPEQVQILNLKPGDTLVLTCDDKLSQEAMAKMGKQLKEQTGCDKVLVLDGGMKLEVVRQVMPTATHNGHYAPVCPKCRTAYIDGDKHQCK